MMRILSCFLAPTAGTVTIGGLDVLRDSLEVRRHVGYLPESIPLYGDMRVGEYLKFRGNLKGLIGKALRKRIDSVTEAFDLVDQKRAVIGRLSKGYRQRVGLADSLLHEPEVLILDEPTIGLDPNQTRNIRTVIKGLAPNHTVLMSSHILPEVETICERIFIMNHGKIVASDTPQQLVGLMKGNTEVVLEVSGPRAEVINRLRAVTGVLNVVADADVAGQWLRLTCECDRARDTRADLAAAVSAENWGLRELGVKKRKLEDVFSAVTVGAEELAPSPEQSTDAGKDA